MLFSPIALIPMYGTPLHDPGPENPGSACRAWAYYSAVNPVSIATENFCRFTLSPSNEMSQFPSKYLSCFTWGMFKDQGPQSTAAKTRTSADLQKTVRSICSVERRKITFEWLAPVRVTALHRGRCLSAISEQAFLEKAISCSFFLNRKEL